MLQKWITGGIYEALDKKYLREIVFTVFEIKKIPLDEYITDLKEKGQFPMDADVGLESISNDDLPGSDHLNEKTRQVEIRLPLEQYTFMIDYQNDGTINMNLNNDNSNNNNNNIDDGFESDFRRRNNGRGSLLPKRKKNKFKTTKDVKRNLVGLCKNLLLLNNIFQQLPENHHFAIRLYYTPQTPKGWQPKHFQNAKKEDNFDNVPDEQSEVVGMYLVKNQTAS